MQGGLIMLNALILAAGDGKRMKSSLAKPLHKLAGLAMIDHVIRLVRSVDARDIAIVASPTLPTVDEAIPTFIQSPAKGTGHAVQCALDWIKTLSGDLLILCGDAPLIQQATLVRLIEQKQNTQADVAVLAADVQGPNQYGRLALEKGGQVCSIMEAKELSAEDLARQTLCNSGVFLVSAAKLPGLLDQLDDNNASGEFYLTDIIKYAHGQGLKTTYSLASEREIQGVNSRADLAKAERTFQEITREAMLDNGVTLQAPETVFFAYDTEIASDVTIEPNVVFGPGVSIASGSRIKAFSHLEGCKVGEQVEVGPFARIRPGTELLEKSKVGNFVELKNTKLGLKSKVNHLSYCGDTTIGEGSNIGAGTITCNYDGARKHQTTIGDGCFIGSNASLVAPVTIGDEAVIAAGSTITNHVDDKALAFARTKQTTLSGKGKVYQDRVKAQKKD